MSFHSYFAVKLFDEKKNISYHNGADGRVTAYVYEESPDSTEKWRRVTPGQGNLRESATEKKPLEILSKGEMVR